MGEWIKCSEQLPKDSWDTMWCWGLMGKREHVSMFKGYYKDGKWKGSNPEIGRDGMYESAFDAVVTHWQKFPEPPQD